MKKIVSFVLIILVSLSINAQKKQVIRPMTKKSKVAIIYGKKKTYYRLNKGLDFPVTNLKKIVIYSRERIKSKTDGYQITYNFDNSKVDTYGIYKSVIDKKSAYINKAIRYRTSKLSKKILNVPKNAETIHLYTDNLVDIYVTPYKNKKTLKPINNPIKKVKVLTGKTAYYYKLNSKIPTDIYLNEVGKLYIYTRKRLSKKDNYTYTFSYKSENSKPTKIIINNAKFSRYATYKSISNRRKPSIYHKTSIDIKEKTKINFSSIDRVDARFVFVKKWKEIYQKNSNQIDLITKKGNKTRKYFRISKNNNFEFNINAKTKTEAKLLLRGEFTYDMLSNSDYKIILKDYDKIITTYKLSCNRSKEMNYKNNADKIPGTLDKIFFKIPKGNHHYTIKIGNKNKTALVRVLIEN